MHCINARRARATAFPYKDAGREGGLSVPRARLVKYVHTPIQARTVALHAVECEPVWACAHIRTAWHSKGKSSARHAARF